MSLATGLVFGLAPALQAGRLNLQEALRDGARGSGQSGRRARLRNGLVVLEIAMALILLVGASLFVRSFLNLQSANPGFDTAPLLTLRVYMTGQTYASADQRVQRIDDIVRRIESLPRVAAAFASNFIPLSEGGGGGGVIIDGKAVAPGEEPFIFLAGTTPHLQKTMAVPLVKGRDFTDAEGMSRTTVAVINETMAKKFWPDADPIGRRFKLAQGEPADWFTVIGVSPDIWRNNINDDQSPLPGAFVPYPYAPTQNTGFTIRASGDPAALTASIRERDSIVRSGARDFRRSAPWKRCGRGLLARPAVWLHVRDLRRGRVVPGRGRRVRRAVVLSVPAHAGDGRAHCARREELGRAWPRRSAGADAGGDRCGAGPAGRLRRHPRDSVAPL